MIEIVVHVYNPRGFDHYAELLRWQWASLLRYQGPEDLVYTVVFSPVDEPTARVIEGMYVSSKKTAVILNPKCVHTGRLFRRAIIRNERALSTAADVLWFTDIDYVLGEHCVDDVARQVEASSGLCFPREISITKAVDGGNDHAWGDAMIDRERQSKHPSLNPMEFKSKRMKVAIGGLQIIGSDMAHKIGYLKDTKWVQPVSTDEGFRSCRGDKVWRRVNKLEATPINVRNVFRIRHSVDGRDYNLAGEKIGKGVW